MGVFNVLDLLLKNAKIIDGTGSPWFKGDIGISGCNIAVIKNRVDIDAQKTIDLDGLSASPGFIDMHTHSDLRVLKHPEEDSKLMQGITTALIGQDGLSVAPIDDKNIPLMKKRLAGLNGTYVENWSWRSMGQYLDEIQKVKPATNYMMLVPHGAVRAMVVGWEARPATAEELDRMKDILANAMAEGGCGFSTGLIYPPGMYADRTELVELLRTTAENQGFFVVHMRNESDWVRESLDEVIGVCMEAGCPLHVSHLKVAGKNNFGRSVEILSVIDNARENGLDVTFDQYPYIAGSTMLDAVIPPWFHEGGVDKLLERLKDKAIREQIRNAQEDPNSKWENWIMSCGWDRIVVTAVGSDKNKAAEGQSIQALSDQSGKAPVDVVADLLIEEENAVTMAIFYGDEADVERIMQHKCTCICSDGIVGGKPHPRVYGTFPRVLGEYVRNRKVLSLEAAVQRMTANPARRLNLQNRGLLKEGMKADITVFDPETVIDVGTYAEPNKYPIGISHVIVNGQIAVENGKMTGTRAGEVIRP
jgi:N-acyl-D-amino-acid deacylase